MTSTVGDRTVQPQKTPAPSRADFKTLVFISYIMGKKAFFDYFLRDFNVKRIFSKSARTDSLR